MLKMCFVQLLVQMWKGKQKKVYIACWIIYDLSGFNIVYLS